jgi:hypothetical protein
MRRALVAIGAGLAVALALAPAALAGRWVAGDLHVHTCYSHDVWCPPNDDNTGTDEAYTFGRTVGETFAIARSRGLDYLAITDHNDIRSQADPGFGTLGVLGVPAYENSLSGHAQMLGATRLYDDGDSSSAAVTALEDALHADGGVFQANHPIDPAWQYGYDVPVDSVEVWNLPWYYQPPLPAASNNDAALRYWEGWLDRGAHVTATGGSDSHWLSTTALQGPGQPTTWTHVSDLTVRGVVDGLRAGHTFVSSEPPAYGGAQAFLRADRNRDGRYESMVGDTVKPRTPLRVRVVDAPGANLQIVTDGGTRAGPPVLVKGGDFEYRFKLPPRDSWVFAEVYGEDKAAERQAACGQAFGANGEPTTYCTNHVSMMALTSALYLRR